MSIQAPIKFARQFGEALIRRDYAAAYAMTSSDFQAQTSQNQLQRVFEDIVPLDWGEFGPLGTMAMPAAHPGKQPGDAAWVYLSIAGDVYSEAVSVVVVQVGEEYKICMVEFGRP